MTDRARKVMATWERGRSLTDQDLEELHQDLEELLSAELDQIAGLANTGHAEQALGRLTRLNSFASAAAQQRPSVIGTLSAQAGKFRAALEAVARALGAVSFTLTFGFPAGISASLTFKVT